MTVLSRPDVAFKDWLEANWECATEGATSSDIDFTNTDWTDDQIQTGRPIIVVRHAGSSSFEREQVEEPNMYKFLLMVEVGIHSPSIAETDAKRTLQWVIVNYLKSLVDGFDSSSITNWHWAVLRSAANLDAAIALPEDVITNITIEALVAWMTS